MLISFLYLHFRKKISKKAVSPEMSTVGHDLGDGSCRVTVCDWRIDGGVFNTDKLWSPGDLCRYSTSDIKGYLSQIKHLLGLKFSDPELQLELDFVPFRVIEGTNGYPLVHSKCNGVDRAFTPVDILAMLISYLESLASEEHRPLNYTNIPHCIGVPIYFTDEQRKDVLEAAKLAKLTSFSLLDETAAMALGYENCWHSASTGIVVFVDIGHANMQVCFAQFERTHGAADVNHKTVCTKILYQAYVRSLGGRDFNKVLFMHFASIIRKKHSIDVYQSANACLRLTDACEGLKKELSTYDKASFCIKKFSGSKDVKGSINRKEFENMTTPILERIKESLEKALIDSGLDRFLVQSIEAVGNECSMPAVINILKEVFEMEPRKMTNSDEYIVRGCAISQVPWIARRRTSLVLIHE